MVVIFSILSWFFEFRMNYNWSNSQTCQKSQQPHRPPIGGHGPSLDRTDRGPAVQVILFEINCTIFFTNLHELFCQFISWTNWVNSGKFMDNCWISCQVTADMKKVYDDLIIINLYLLHLKPKWGQFWLVQSLGLVYWNMYYIQDKFTLQIIKKMKPLRNRLQCLQFDTP